MAISIKPIVDRIGKSGPTIVLIAINLVFFMAVRLSATALSARETVETLGLSQSLAELLNRPWTPVTYMFTHVDFTHLFFNMVWLGISAAVLSRMCSRRSVYLIYLVSGLAGAIVFILVGEPGSFLIGASCAVFGLLSAAATSLRDFSIDLPFIGSVNAAVALAVFIVLHLIYIFIGSTIVAASHLAGITAGIICVAAVRWRSDTDPDEENAATELIRQKITSSGYASLSDEEKRIIKQQTNKQS